MSYIDAIRYWFLDQIRKFIVWRLRRLDTLKHSEYLKDKIDEVVKDFLLGLSGSCYSVSFELTSQHVNFWQNVPQRLFIWGILVRDIWITPNNNPKKPKLTGCVHISFKSLNDILKTLAGI